MSERTRRTSTTRTPDKEMSFDYRSFDYRSFDYSMFGLQAEHVDRILTELNDKGFALVKNISAPRIKDEIADRLWAARGMLESMGLLEHSSLSCGYCLIRLLPALDPFFLTFLEYEPLRLITEKFLRKPASLRFMQGTIYPAQKKSQSVSSYTPDNQSWHRNFPHIWSPEPLSFEWLVSVTPDTVQKLDVVPGSHKFQQSTPDYEHLEAEKIILEIESGDWLFMDGFLWHKENTNYGASDIIYVSSQLTNSFIRPHFDHRAAIKPEIYDNLSTRTKKMLGTCSRLPADLHEFFESR